MSETDPIRAEIMHLWKSSAFRAAAELLPSDNKAAVQQVLHSARFFMRDLEQHEPQLLDALGTSKKAVLYTWILQEQGVWDSAAGTTGEDWLGPRDVVSQPPASSPPRVTSDS